LKGKLPYLGKPKFEKDEKKNGHVGIVKKTFYPHIAMKN